MRPIRLTVKMLRSLSARLYFTSLLLVAGAFTVLAAIHQSGDNVIRVDNFKYSVPGKGSLKILGLCSTDMQNFTCWDPTGAPNPALATRANAYFLVTSSAFLQLRFKAPSIVMVTEAEGQQFPNYISDSNWSDTAGLKLTTAGQAGYSNWTVPQLAYYWLYPEADQKSDDLYLTLNSSFNFPDRLPLKVGATTEKDGKSLTITGITEETITVPPSRYPQFTGQNTDTKKVQMKTWRIDYKRSDFPDMNADSIFSEALQLDGTQVGSTDINGKPVGQGQYLNMNYQRYLPQTKDDPSTKTGSFSIQTDPKYVKDLIISYGTSTKIVFPNIALQPTS